jgi:hypothetical protein
VPSKVQADKQHSKIITSSMFSTFRIRITSRLPKSLVTGRSRTQNFKFNFKSGVNLAHDEHWHRLTCLKSIDVPPNYQNRNYTITVLRIMARLKPSISINEFPTELILELTDCCEIEDLLSLCRTSKCINAVVTRVLYRSITLRSAGAAVRCFQTMLAHPDCALAVRVLDMYATCPTYLAC